MDICILGMSTGNRIFLHKMTVSLTWMPCGCIMGYYHSKVNPHVWHIKIIKPSSYIVPFVNSLAPGRFQFNFRKAIFKLILVDGGWGISYEIVLRWMPLDLTDDKSTLVQVMAWCHQASSHYLSQCWSRPMSPYGVTRPQWVKAKCSIVDFHTLFIIAPTQLSCWGVYWFHSVRPSVLHPVPAFIKQFQKVCCM